MTIASLVFIRNNRLSIQIKTARTTIQMCCAEVAAHGEDIRRLRPVCEYLLDVSWLLARYLPYKQRALEVNVSDSLQGLLLAV